VWRWLLAALGLSLLAAGYALTPYAIPEVSRTLPPLSEIRALALSSGQPLPVEVRTLLVADNVTYRFIVIAGESFREQPMVSHTFQPVYADGRTLLIDAVADEEVMKSVFARSRVFPQSYARMQEAMRQAEHIVVTHEHFDHSSGISRSPHLAELASRVAMTDAQLQGALAEGARFTPDVVRLLEPLRYERLHLLAPGVVLVKAPGHTPGSQLVYVRLDDGRELLFVGDIAWNMDNIRLPRGHSRWVSWALPEDGPVMADQLRYLHDVMVREPTVRLVVAHDGEQLSDYLRQGLLVEGLR
jgi:glyoxylase-like metal-dependent hydrolase (beta-lactamase superfamily II)